MLGTSRASQSATRRIVMGGWAVTVAIACAAAPAFGCTDGGSILPMAGGAAPPLGPMEVTGTAFLATTEVKVLWGGQRGTLLLATTTDAAGYFKVLVRVPADALPGPYVLAATQVKQNGTTQVATRVVDVVPPTRGEASSPPPEDPGSKVTPATVAGPSPPAPNPGPQVPPRGAASSLSTSRPMQVGPASGAQVISGVVEKQVATAPVGPAVARAAPAEPAVMPIAPLADDLWSALGPEVGATLLDAPAPASKRVPAGGLLAGSGVAVMAAAGLMGRRRPSLARSSWDR